MGTGVRTANYRSCVRLYVRVVVVVVVVMGGSVATAYGCRNSWSGVS